MGKEQYVGLRPLDNEELDAEKCGIKIRETHYFVAEYKSAGIMNPKIRHADVIVIRGDEEACERAIRNIPGLDSITECDYKEIAEGAADAFNSYARDIGTYGVCKHKEVRTEYLNGDVMLQLEIDMDEDEYIKNSKLTVFWVGDVDDIVLFNVDEMSGESDIDEDKYLLLQQLPSETWNVLVGVVESFVISFDMDDDPVFEYREVA